MLDSLLENIPNRVVIVTTWKPEDIQSGSSELSLYPFCQRRNIALYVCQELHLKVYSVELTSAILATGNVSRRGLLPNGNYEAAIRLDPLSIDDRLFFEKIRKKARLVDDAMYEKFLEWSMANPPHPAKPISLSDVVTLPSQDDFSVASLPMTMSVGKLAAGYRKICVGEKPSKDLEMSACIMHDLANYDIEIGLGDDEFIQSLRIAFFSHPFIRRIDEFISPQAYFGRIKEWIQDNCTDVPVPSRRALTGNVQVLLEWFVVLGSGKYVVDVPGARSQRIRNVTS